MLLAGTCVRHFGLQAEGLLDGFAISTDAKHVWVASPESILAFKTPAAQARLFDVYAEIDMPEVVVLGICLGPNEGLIALTTLVSEDSADDESTEPVPFFAHVLSAKGKLVRKYTLCTRPFCAAGMYYTAGSLLVAFGTATGTELLMFTETRDAKGKISFQKQDVPFLSTDLPDAFRIHIQGDMLLLGSNQQLATYSITTKLPLGSPLEVQDLGDVVLGANNQVIIGTAAGSVRVLNAANLHAPAQVAWQIEMDAEHSWNPEREYELDSDYDDSDEDDSAEDDSVEDTDDDAEHDSDDAADKDDDDVDVDAGGEARSTAAPGTPVPQDGGIGWGGIAGSDCDLSALTTIDNVAASSPAVSSITSTDSISVFTDIINMALVNGQLFVRTQSDDILVYE